MLKDYWSYLKVVLKHKWYVFLACKDIGITWRGIVHDLSKFTPMEFKSYCEHFINDCRNDIFYGWFHHKGHNTHHWNYWTDFKNGETIAVKMPKKDVLELICDFVGAGKAYTDDWNESEPYNFWIRVRDTICIEPYTKAFIEDCFIKIKNKGWKKFCKCIKLKYIEY